MENKKDEKTETVKVGAYKNKLATDTTSEKDNSSSTNLETSGNKVVLKTKFVPTENTLKNKNIAWLAYLLFFIPLLINKKSPFVRHHANEGLEINLFDAIAIVLLLIGTLTKDPSTAVNGLLIICVLIGSGLLVLTTITKIYMITTTLQGKFSNAPWTWNLRIIK